MSQMLLQSSHLSSGGSQEPGNVPVAFLVYQWGN